MQVSRALATIFLVTALAKVDECSADPIARAKRHHEPGHEFSSTQEAKIKVVADIITYFLHQRGCSSEVVQNLMTQQCSGSPSGDDQKGTFKTVLNYLEFLPDDNIYIIERKVQYGSVIITVLSNGVSGSDGSDEYKYIDFKNHLESSKEKYQSEQNSSVVIKYIINNMYEIESTQYIKTSFKSLITVTYGSEEEDESDSDEKPCCGNDDNGSGGDKGHGDSGSQEGGNDNKHNPESHENHGSGGGKPGSDSNEHHGPNGGNDGSDSNEHHGPDGGNDGSDSNEPHGPDGGKDGTGSDEHHGPGGGKDGSGSHEHHGPGAGKHHRPGSKDHGPGSKHHGHGSHSKEHGNKHHGHGSHSKEHGHHHGSKGHSGDDSSCSDSSSSSDNSYSYDS